MTSLKFEARRKLSDEEIYEFQKTKFSRSFGLICRLASGRFVVCNGLRDPVAVVTTLDELHMVATAMETNDISLEKSSARLKRSLTRAEEKATEEEELRTSLPVNL